MRHLPDWQSSSRPASTSEIEVRHPTKADASAIWRFVRESDILDTNSCYAYLLLCQDFARTCVVAVDDGRLVGFTLGYVPPQRPDVAFVWQVAVSPEARGRGLGRQLLREWLSTEGCRHARFLEATVTPSNGPSRRLFRSLANELDAEFTVRPGFAGADFGDSSHEREDLIRIGPIRRSHGAI